jgi:2-hydroxy-4-carboxymuconate semialdehyde hemiacetal dehydrogenase
MAVACLETGKHALVEIPIAMNLADAERVVAAALDRGLTLGVVYPMRFRAERQPVVDRIRRGVERVSHHQGRFFIHRLSNVGATGLQRSWTDNLLWHHSTPAMRVLHRAQEDWDATHGKQVLPGRPVT